MAPTLTICTGCDEPEQERPDDRAAAELRQQLCRDIGAVQFRHDQDVGRARQAGRTGRAGASAAGRARHRRSSRRHIRTRHRAGRAAPRRRARARRLAHADCRNWNRTAARPAARARARAPWPPPGPRCRRAAPRSALSWTRVSAISTVRSRASRIVSPKISEPGLTAMTRETLVEHVERVARDPGHHRVGIAAGDHAGGEDVAVLVHQPLAVAIQHAPALLAARRGNRCSACCAATAARCGFRAPAASVKPHRRHRRLDALLAADQHRRAVAALREQQRGADRLLLLALGEDDALRRGAHPFEDQLEPRRGRVEPGRAALRL